MGIENLNLEQVVKLRGALGISSKTTLYENDYGVLSVESACVTRQNGGGFGGLSHQNWVGVGGLIHQNGRVGVLGCVCWSDA